MNRKRVIIWALVLCVLWTYWPMQACAEEKELVLITLGQYDDVAKETRLVQYRVLKEQNDFLFSGEDLSVLTGFEYRVEGNNAFFTRGSKVINIDVKEGLLQTQGSISLVELENPVIVNNNKLYFSAASLLPWLNVTCYEDSGILYIISDMISVWDFIDNFEQEKDSLVFDFNLCCQQLDVDSKWVQVASYLKSHLISGLVKDFVWIPFSAHSYGTYQDYYDIFEKMIEQKNSIYETYEEIVDNGKTISAGFSFIDAIDNEADIPDVYEAFRIGGKILSKASDALDMAIYFHSFYQDNREKIMWLKCVSGNRQNFEYPEAMIHAVFDIQAAYSNELDGVGVKVTQKLLDNVIDKLIDKMTGEGITKALLEGIGFYEKLVPDWNQGISNIGYNNAIASCGINVYEQSQRTGFTDIGDIEQRRAHISLFLYSSAQNWEVMYEYAKDKGYDEWAMEYQKKADVAYSWLGRFIASSNATINDSFRYSQGKLKEVYTEELKVIFTNTDIEESLGENSTNELQAVDFLVIDYAILTRLLCLDDEVYGCDTLDLNKDGDSELIISKANKEANNRIKCYIVDEQKINVYVDDSLSGESELIINYEEGIAGVVYRSYSVIQYPDVYKVWNNRWQEWTNEVIYGEPLRNAYESITSVVVQNTTFEKMCNDYECHLKNMGVNYFFEYSDTDGDGEQEAKYIVENYCGAWECLEEELFAPIAIVIIDNKNGNIELHVSYDIEKKYLFEVCNTSDTKYNFLTDMLINNTFYKTGEQDMFFYVYTFEEDGRVYIERCNVDGTIKWGETESYPYDVQESVVIIDNVDTYFYQEELGILATEVTVYEDEIYGVFKDVKWLVPYSGNLSFDVYNDFSNYYFTLINE